LSTATLDAVLPDQFVVQFKRGVAHQLQVAPGSHGRPRANLASVQRAFDRVGAVTAEREFRSARPQAVGSRFPDLTGYYLVSIPAGTDLQEAMASMAAEPDVDHVEPIGVHAIDLTPNDTWWIYGTTTFPYDQWHYWDNWGIDADLAWNQETGDPNVVVAILDTGMRYRHSDLGGNDPPGPADNVTQGNVWVNPFEIPANGIDDEGNGYIDDVIGWDFVASTIAGTCDGYDVDCGFVENDPNDGEGHGTFCSGIVAAITNNARAGASVAGGFSDGTTAGAGNGVKVMAMRIGHRARVNLPPPVTTGVVSMAYAAQAMNYVADMKSRGVNVAAVNCSWGSSNTGGISAAVDNLLANDVMVIYAAGNSNSSTAPFVATKPGVLVVGASDSTGVGASFSNFGTWVDMAAPGVGIFSITHNPDAPDTISNYVSVGDGTSFSTPMTCGVAALLESYNPALTGPDKFALIVGNTSAFAPANTKQLGTGILNAYNALQAAPSPVGVPLVHGASAGALALRASPNPASAGAALALRSLPGARVDVAVIDAAGRQVRSLSGVAAVDGTLRLRWDGLDASGRRAGTGVYMIQATAGRDRASAKLVVLE
jgi:hypothetical protein